MDLSTDDATFGEGTTLTNAITGGNDDERLTAAPSDVRLGAHYTFSVSYNAAPAVGTDVSLAAKTWFIGSFLTDTDGDGVADDNTAYVLSDADSNGLYDTLDLSTDDATFGEGTLSNAVTGTNDDERLATSGDLRIGDYYTFTASFAGNPPAVANDATLTAKTWFTGTFLADVDGDGASDDTVSFALTDSNSDGVYDTLDLSSDDGVFGEGVLSNTSTGSNDDERLTTPGTITFGSAQLGVSFDANPAADTSDFRTASSTWYVASFLIDADADGAADDTVNAVLSDNDSNGQYETLDLSIGNTTYRQGTVDATASADGSDDAAVTSSGSAVILGSYTFIAAYDGAPGSAATDASLTSTTWFRVNLAIDVDGNGTAGASEVAAVLSDSDSNGLYDTLDLQTDDSGSLTSGFGEGTLSGQSPRQTGNNDDERLGIGTGGGNSGGGADVRLGSNLLFAVAFDNNPAADSSDVRATSSTWYTAQLPVDVDGNGTASASETAFVMTDADSDGRYDTLDIQTDDGGSLTSGFGEGTLSGQTPRQTANNDDERIGIGTGGGNSGGSADVRLGASNVFTIAFDNFPADSGTDITLTSKTWYTGAFTLDADADGAADDTLSIAVTDTGSNGLFSTMDLSLGDATFGEGSLVDALLLVGNDARITSSTDFNVGSANYLFAFTFVANPPAASITAKTHFEGTFVFDENANSMIDGASETIYFGLADLNSDGLYDTMDLSLGDTDFAEGSLTNLLITDGDDERLSVTTTIDVGASYAIQVSWDNNPPATGDDDDARILLISDGSTIIAYTALNSWQVDGDGDEVADDHVYFVLSDTNSDAIVDTIDLSIGDIVFGEGSLADALVDYGASNNTNDERFTLSAFPLGKVVRLGTHNFLTAFDAAVNADADDARITARWYVGTWPVDVDNDDTDNIIDFVQVDTDSDGIFTVIEIDTDDSGAYSVSEVFISAGSSWRPHKGVFGEDDLGTHSSLTAVDADTLLVAFYDATDDDLLFSKSTDGGATWSQPVTVDASGDPGRYASLKVLSAASYLVSYYVASSGDLRIARTADGGASWTVTTVDSAGDTGQYTSLLVLDSSTALVSYYDVSNSRLKVAKTTDGGTTWPAINIVEVDNAADVGKFSSLAGVRSGQLFAAYYDATNGDLKVARSLTGGATWSVLTVLDSTGDVGQYASAVAAFDSTPDNGDTVNIAWYDVSQGRIKFSRTANAAAVAPTFTTPVIVDSGNVGLYLSLAAVEQGNAFLSYYDASAKTLKAARSTDGGATWSLAVADNEVETGTYTSIAVPPGAGLTKVYISYYDADLKDLRVKESRLLVDFEGHRLSVRYRFNPRLTDSAVIRTGGPIVVAQKGPDLWHITVPGDLPAGQEQAELRIRMHIPSGAAPGEFRGALSMEF